MYGCPRRLRPLAGFAALAALVVLRPSLAARPQLWDAEDGSAIQTEDANLRQVVVEPEADLGMIDSPGFRLGDGITVKFQYCKLKKTFNQVNMLPSTEWNPVSVPLPWLVRQGEGDPTDPVGYKLKPFNYSFVPGSAFDLPGVQRDRYFGFCYREAKFYINSMHTCICGAVELQGEDRLASKNEAIEQSAFHGCSRTVPLPVPDAGASEMVIGEGIRTRAVWSHPLSLWMEVERDSWCELTLEVDMSQRDTSLAHGLPFCVAAQYVQDLPSETIEASGKEINDILYHIYWAAAYDHFSPTGWFKSSQIRFKLQWRRLALALNGSPEGPPHTYNKSSAGVLRTVKAGKDLCSTMLGAAPAAWRELASLYETYMEEVNIQASKTDNISNGYPPRGQKPLFVIAGGPPSSGKSITSMSSYDFALMAQKTKRSGDPHFAFNGRSYEQFQAGTVELNVDRIVEATDLSRVSKEHMAIRERWVKALQKTKQASDSMAKIAQDEGQREYWFLRKAAGIDDLSNAHIQRVLAMGQDVIYETLIGDGWLPWALKFELPKVKAAGYEIVMVDYVVPTEELVLRAFEREKRTGQTAAPAQQIESDAQAAPTNFMKPELLELVDYGIALSHVRRGETEDALAVFRNPDGEGCFTHCADDDMLLEYNVGMMRRCKFATCD